MSVAVIPSAEWTSIISASVVPVVIISACGLLSLAFYNRLGSIVSRLRTFQRERLHEYDAWAKHLRTGAADETSEARHHRLLDMLEHQTKRVYRRARMIRHALLCLLGTILCLTLCSLATGLSVVWSPMRFAAEGLFIFGMLLLAGGVLFAFLEMRDSLEPVHLESRFVSQLAHELEEEMQRSAKPASRSQ